MTSILRNVLYLLDAEGFGEVSNFVVKELAIYNIDKCTSNLWYFKVGNRNKLTKAEFAQANYLRRKTHGLAYKDEPRDLEQSCVKTILTDLCLDAEKKNKFVAYKGRAHIDRLVNNLGFAHIAINIEDLECQRYVDIIENYPWIYEKCLEHQCARHHWLSNGQLGQCSRMKLFVYLEYLRHIIRTRLTRKDPEHNHHYKDSSCEN